MKKPIVPILLLLLSVDVMAEDTTSSALEKNIKDHYGYSYMTFGVENVRYKETFTDANSDVTTTSPILNTGGLYRLNEKFDFSIDALATFSPQSSTEEWSDDNGVVYQNNKLEYMRAATHILLHYKVTPTWRFITGPALTYQTYTRSDRNYLDNSSIDPATDIFREGETWEEKSTDIFWDLGVAYEPGTLFSGNKWHKQLKFAVGLPVWSVTENSRFTDATFNDSGYRAYLDGSLSYEVLDGIHVGWYLQYSYEKRFQEGPKRTYARNVNGDLIAGEAWLPEADIHSFSTGLQVLWKL